MILTTMRVAKICKVERRSAQSLKLANQNSQTRQMKNPLTLRIVNHQAVINDVTSVKQVKVVDDSNKQLGYIVGLVFHFYSICLTKSISLIENVYFRQF